MELEQVLGDDLTAHCGWSAKSQHIPRWHLKNQNLFRKMRACFECSHNQVCTTYKGHSFATRYYKTNYTKYITIIVAFSVTYVHCTYMTQVTLTTSDARKTNTYFRQKTFQLWWCTRPPFCFVLFLFLTFSLFLTLFCYTWPKKVGGGDMSQTLFEAGGQPPSAPGSYSVVVTTQRYYFILCGFRPVSRMIDAAVAKCSRSIVSLASTRN